jgi:hypothetical protein
MTKVSIFILLFFICNEGKTQISSGSADSITIKITKVDSSKTRNITNKNIFELIVSNQTDSTICLLSSFEMDGNVNKKVLFLQPAYSCNDTLRYYSLEHCRDWNIGYLPLPAKPILLNPNTYFKTFFSFEIAADNPNTFHLHYASVDKTVAEIQRTYKNDEHNWQHSFSLKCKQVRLPY